MITAWSYTRWSTYKTCPRSAGYSYAGDTRPPFIETAALKKGKLVHEQCEHYITGERDDLVHKALWGWADEMAVLRTSKYDAEYQLTYTVDMTITEWFAKDAWLRMAFDASKLGTDHTAHIIDFKTGREYPDHVQQAELYAVGAYWLDMKEVTVEFWYLEQDKIQPFEFDEKELEALNEQWMERGETMTTDTEFVARPSRASCGKYGGCQFASDKGGPCEYTTQGVLADD